MPGVGDIILQAAQTIVAQKQGQQRLMMQAEQLKQQVDQQKKVFDLRQQELDIRDRTIKVQEEQAQRAQELAPFRVQEAQLGVQKTQAEIGLVEAKTMSELLPKPEGRGGLTSNQRLRVHEDVEMRATAIETSQVAQAFEQQSGAALPRLSSPEEYLEMARKMRNKVSEFQTSNSAQQAVLTRKFAGDESELEIDKIQSQLTAIDAFIQSPEFKQARDRISSEGPRPESRQAVIQKFYAPFAGQIDPRVGPTTTPSFDYGTTAPDKVKGAWGLFSEGNVEMLTDVVLDANGGVFGPDQKAAFEQELSRRFPTPGPDQDAAISNWRRMYDRIQAQKDN